MTLLTPLAAGPAGYLHPAYAASLATFGTPRHLPLADGWILERGIPGAQDRDAMGCYPIFACRDWSRLHLDLDEIGKQLVSLVLVADPFGDYGPGDLQRCFPDLLTNFKEHFVISLASPLRSFVDTHHQRNARKALRELTVERCLDPPDLAGEWTELYAHLIARHDIRGPAAFSPLSLAQQLRVPGLNLFCARLDGEIVGMTLWYADDAAGYYHLGAYSERGYALRASFALFWHALEYFAEAGVRQVDLGAGAGARAKETDGLSRFKRGWATGTRTAYLCGRIFDPERYAALTTASGAGGSGYFPAYRSGEFG